MVTIDSAKCTGCGACVRDCFPHNLVLESGKAKVINEVCMQCGHCVAICPAQAVSIPNYDMADVEDIAPQKFSADELLSAIKGRRSVRQFRNQAVDRVLIEQIIQAGRYTATASNKQGLSFIVVEQEMQSFRSMVLQNLSEMGQKILVSKSTPSPLKGYAQRWISMRERFEINPGEQDEVFFGAPVAILVSGGSTLDAGLAASNMELEACAQGLGVLYSGFITRACSTSEVKALVGVPAGKEVQIALVIGYPNVKYKRSAPRKPADIVWC